MKLRIIPTKTHAAVDMATGPVLVAAPTLLRMNGNTGATIPPRVVGSLATAYSLLTDYELGLKRIVPMRAHLALDALGGVALAATPFLTGASKKGDRHWLPPPRRPRTYAPRVGIAAAALAAVTTAALVGRRVATEN